MQKPGLSRRGVLAAALGVGATGLLLKAGVMDSFAAGEPNAVVPAGGTLRLPPLLQATQNGGVKVFKLEMTKGSTQVIAGTASPSAGFNGALLGPTIRVADGENIRFEVTNRLGADSTVHWHGLHVAPSVDGGPQNIIKDGTTWTPAMTIKQPAGTMWYHPHGLLTTAQQVALGLAGMIIIDDATDASRALPKDYGADDFPLILTSTAITATGAFANSSDALDAADSRKHFLVNGASATTATPTVIANRNRLRFRPLNASLTHTITITRTDGKPFTQVASDAGLLPKPLAVTSLRLVAGERAEFILDVAKGETITLRAAPEDAGAAQQPTVSMLAVTTTGADTPPALPATLSPLVPLVTTGAKTRTFTLNATGDNQTINGIAGTTIAAMNANMVMVNLGDTEVWDVVNAADIAHSFHLHDVPFQILSIGGNAPTGANVAWKDTIEVPARTTVKIAMKFTDFTDPTFMYMLHCHNLEHEDLGMMLGLMVTQRAATRPAQNEDTQPATASPSTTLTPESTPTATASGAPAPSQSATTSAGTTAPTTGPTTVTPSASTLPAPADVTDVG